MRGRDDANIRVLTDAITILTVDLDCYGGFCGTIPRASRGNTGDGINRTCSAMAEERLTRAPNFLGFLQGAACWREHHDSGVPRDIAQSVQAG